MFKRFSLLSFHSGKSHNGNGACVHKAIRQTNHHFHESIFRVYCHGWVKLRAEQLCGFCTSRSPIVCGKLPLQLIFSQFNVPPLHLYIKVQSLQQQKILHILQWRRCTCREQKKVAI